MRFACALALAVLLGAAVPANADTITIGGAISQSIQDGTGPAVNNAGLNNIVDGDSYTITLDFTGSISGTGTYDLTGAALSFTDPTASAIETSFDTVSLTVSDDGGSDDVSLLGCLTTGSGCFFGNYLALNFQIPSAGLNSQNVAAQGISGLYPSLDLLEDDGTTDIEASVTAYSYTAASVAPTPEPGSFVFVCCGLIALAWKRAMRQRAAQEA